MLNAEQRVVADIEAEHVALERQLLALFPLLLGDRRQHSELHRALSVEAAEERVLALRLLTLLIDEGVDVHLVHAHQPTAAVPERVERAGLGQRLDRALVAHHDWHLAQEVLKRAVASVCLAGGDDPVDHVGADVADRGQAEANVGADRGEVGGRLVHIRWQHLDAHPAALGEIERGLVLVVAHAGQHRGHVLGREVRLEVRSPVRHQPVRRTVRLVERVVRERDQDLPQRCDARR